MISSAHRSILYRSSIDRESIDVTSKVYRYPDNHLPVTFGHRLTSAAGMEIGTVSPEVRLPIMTSTHNEEAQSLCWDGKQKLVILALDVQ